MADESATSHRTASPGSVITSSAVETEQVGRQLAERIGPGTVILLYGDLGAGKTAFIRGLASGLGIPSDDVCSPTFTIVQEYRGRLRLQHADLYRLRPGAEVEELGLEEDADRGDVVAIEWADRLPAPPPGAVVVRIEDRGGDSRQITIDVGDR